MVAVRVGETPCADDNAFLAAVLLHERLPELIRLLRVAAVEDQETAVRQTNHIAHAVGIHVCLGQRKFQLGYGGFLRAARNGRRFGQVRMVGTHHAQGVFPVGGDVEMTEFISLAVGCKHGAVFGVVGEALPPLRRQKAAQGAEFLNVFSGVRPQDRTVPGCIGFVWVAEIVHDINRRSRERNSKPPAVRHRLRSTMQQAH